ncbi:beta-galactosidase 11-like [Tasmannia lanceolata]|uniref:beta-galactosidase 11-like n=1 Tax=Tasmannia lanceolata TaxID=3420 RepID=UPI004063FB96
MSSLERTILLNLVFLFILYGTTWAHGDDNVFSNVTYDRQSLLIGGKRHLLFSGSIHYPRSPAEMWPDIIKKAKKGGLNVIQTYVFWNIHEPVEGQFNFEGRNDLVRFVKLIQEHNMFVTLRLGPFIQGEWNFGGFPVWLREVKDITFRTNNPQFKYYMKRYAKMIVNMMKKEKLFASQGGPIILSQIENEYNNIQLAFEEAGKSYVRWAGKMAVGLNTGVPWVMCKQKDAPDPVINSCNGRNCGDTFTGPNGPNKPFLWTENWTAQYRVFGDPPSQRTAEDLAFAVARFFSKNGTLVNYYMYHGGTNYGRTASAFVTTRYYDEAPLDEYGLEREPKYGHLRDLHRALNLSKKALLWGSYSVQYLRKSLEARVYEIPGTNVCAAFLSNIATRITLTGYFRGVEYSLPPRSISILPDCKTVVYNTQRINTQHNARNYVLRDESNRNMHWTMFQEKIPKLKQSPIKTEGPMDHLNMTKDTSDYLWYTTILRLHVDDLPLRHDIRPIISIQSLGHAVHAFVNDVYVGSDHGDKIEKSFHLKKPITLKAGTNHISLLAMTIGLPDSGVYLERRLSGIRQIRVLGLNLGTLDLSSNEWGHKVGLLGERLQIFNDHGSQKVKWLSAKGSKGTPLTWYKRYFDSPHGDGPVALDFSKMGKGHAWVNGESIGRYWVSYLSPLGSPSQSLYHVPRAFLKPTNNLLVFFEETGGDPQSVVVLTVNRETICGYVSEAHPPHVKSWVREKGEIRAIMEEMKPSVRLKCPDKNKVMKKIDFVSYGDPSGVCGNFTRGTCHSPLSENIVQKACFGKNSCKIPVTQDTLGTLECPRGVAKTLAVQAICGTKKRSSE